MVKKQHLAVLDWLRGGAAIVVVVFHLYESIYQSHNINPFMHGFLAVDFFFCLSGFVFGYSYNSRIGKLSYLSFLKKRIIRLHPLVVLGTFLGILIYFLDPWGNYSRLWNINLIGIAYLQSNLLIPTLISIPNRYGNLFPFNPPSWSLSLEYIASIAYIFFLWKLSNKLLIVLLGFAGFFLIYIAHKNGTLSGGWHADSFTTGVGRMSFSFLAGLTIHRCNFTIKNNVGFILITIFLLATFMLPYYPYNWLIEVIIIMFFYPMIIAFSAKKKISSKLAKVGSLLGSISYPLYLTHYWFISSLSSRPLKTI